MIVVSVAWQSRGTVNLQNTVLSYHLIRTTLRAKLGGDIVHLWWVLALTDLI